MVCQVWKWEIPSISIIIRGPVLLPFNAVIKSQLKGQKKGAHFGRPHRQKVRRFGVIRLYIHLLFPNFLRIFFSH